MYSTLVLLSWFSWQSGGFWICVWVASTTIQFFWLCSVPNTGILGGLRPCAGPAPIFSSGLCRCAEHLGVLQQGVSSLSHFCWLIFGFNSSPFCTVDVFNFAGPIFVHCHFHSDIGLQQVLHWHFWSSTCPGTSRLHRPKGEPTDAHEPEPGWLGISTSVVYWFCRASVWNKSAINCKDTIPRIQHSLQSSPRRWTQMLHYRGNASPASAFAVGNTSTVQSAVNHGGWQWIPILFLKFDPQLQEECNGIKTNGKNNPIGNKRNGSNPPDAGSLQGRDPKKVHKDHMQKGKASRSKQTTRCSMVHNRCLLCPPWNLHGWQPQQQRPACP